MAIIDPEGLFEGERLAACSDIAQLYWQRLFLAANSCGRMQLSYAAIISKVFKTFKNPPTESSLWSVFEELERNYLAILYEVHGVWWCQFVTSEKYLPKYKKARDEASPAPSHEMVAFHATGYETWKRQNSSKNQSFRKPSETFQRRGIGEVVGEEEVKAEEWRGAKKGASPQTQPQAQPIDTPSLVREIVCSHPKSKLRSMVSTEVSQAQEIAVLDAMAAEMKRAGIGEREALELILRLTNQLAEKVPRNEWRFFKDAPVFFRNMDYRVDPEDFAGKGKHGKHEGNKSAAVGRVDGSQSAWSSAFPDDDETTPGAVDADVGSVPESRAGAGDGEGVAPGIRGSGDRVRGPNDRAVPAQPTEPAEILSPPQRSPRRP